MADLRTSWRFAAITPANEVFHSGDISERLDFDEAREAAIAWFEDGEPRLKPGRYTLLTERSADLAADMQPQRHGRDRR